MHRVLVNASPQPQPAARVRYVLKQHASCVQQSPVQGLHQQHCERET